MTEMAENYGIFKFLYVSFWYGKQDNSFKKRLSLSSGVMFFLKARVSLFNKIQKSRTAFQDQRQRALV